MEDGLARALAVVGDEAVVLEAEVAGDRGGPRDDLADELPVLGPGVGELRDVLARDDEDVRRRLRRDVVEGVDAIVGVGLSSTGSRRSAILQKRQSLICRSSAPSRPAPPASLPSSRSPRSRWYTRSIVVSPSAVSAAMARAAEARRSLAMTRAPVRRAGPSTTAQRPSRRMRAPMRTSSATCWKRFSKMVSVIVATPSMPGGEGHPLRLQVGREARVGRGRDVVRDEGPRGPHAQRVARRPRSRAPVAARRIVRAARCSGTQRRIATSPRVAAAARA